jgi:hypothetical protein
MKKTSIIGIALLGVLAIVGAACGDTAETKAAPSASTAAASLRVALDGLFKEHVGLAAAATENALSGQTKAFQAAAAALDANSVDLSKAIGSVYGADAEKAFLPLWRSHINFVVDYTSNFADKAKQDKAVQDLLQYTQTFGAFLAGANPSLTKDAVAMLVKDHILTLKDVIDAQYAKDYAKAYTALRMAAHHMEMISSALADAIVKQFPDKFA